MCQYQDFIESSSFVICFVPESVACQNQYFTDSSDFDMYQIQDFINTSGFDI